VVTRRISQGQGKLSGKVDIRMLRDMDQPFVFELRSKKAEYRLECYDTSSPDNWRLIRPDLVVICYDISQRLSLINMQRVVSFDQHYHYIITIFGSDLVVTNLLVQWIKEVRTMFENDDTLPIVVLGLKRDLRSEDDPNGIIYPQEAYRIAQEMRADKYAECSAVTGELLPETFEDIYLTAVKTTTEEGGQAEGACVLM